MAKGLHLFKKTELKLKLSQYKTNLPIIVQK